MRYSQSTRLQPSIAVPIGESTRASTAGSKRHGIVRPRCLRSARVLLQMTLATALATALSFTTGAAMAAGDAEAGAAKAWTCLGCHGVDHYVNVYPSYHVPRIAGQNEEYLIAALQAYRGKLRAHPTMQANASLLSDQDIQDIAAWLSQQGTAQ